MSTDNVFPTLPEPVALEAIGAVTIRHSAMEDTVRMLLRTLLRQTAEEARTYFHRKGIGQLRDKLAELARAVFGPGLVLDQLVALLEQGAALSARRNEWVHALYGEDWLGQPLHRNKAGDWVIPPTPAELHALAQQIHAMTQEMRRERSTGFLAGPLLAKGYNFP
jgi:hypothetical protein